MRAARRSLGILSCAACALACAVYRDDMVHPKSDGSSTPDSAGSSSGSLAGAGRGGNGSGSGGGASVSLGGTPAAGGTTGSHDAGAGPGEGPGEGGAGGVGSAGDGWGGEGGGNAEAGGAGSGSTGGSSAGGSAGQSTTGGAPGSGGAPHGGGGAGGSPAPTCSAYPLTPRGNWRASASHDYLGATPASNMLDNKATRWTTGKPQAGDEWIELDFGTSVSLNRVNLQQAEANANDYPRQYEVRVSDTSQDPNASTVVSGSGASGVSTAIALPAVKTGQFLLIKQLGASLSWWSVVEIEVSCVD